MQCSNESASAAEATSKFIFSRSDLAGCFLALFAVTIDFPYALGIDGGTGCALVPLHSHFSSSVVQWEARRECQRRGLYTSRFCRRGKRMTFRSWFWQRQFIRDLRGSVVVSGSPLTAFKAIRSVMWCAMRVFLNRGGLPTILSIVLPILLTVQSTSPSVAQGTSESGAGWSWKRCGCVEQGIGCCPFFRNLFAGYGRPAQHPLLRSLRS